MVLGGMADTGVRGVKRYCDVYAKLDLTNDEKDEVSELCGGNQLKYLKARSAQLSHDVAMIVSYGDLMESEAFCHAQKYLTEEGS